MADEISAVQQEAALEESSRTLRRRDPELASCHIESRVFQFTVTLTVAGFEVVLLGAAPFSSAPVSVNV